MSRGFSGGKQEINFSNTRNRSEVRFILDNSIKKYVYCLQLPLHFVLMTSASVLSSDHTQSKSGGHLSSVVMSTTLAIDKSTPETPSPSPMLLASSTVVSQQSGTLFSDDLIEIQRTLQSNLHVRPYLESDILL